MVRVRVRVSVRVRVRVRVSVRLYAHSNPNPIPEANSVKPCRKCGKTCLNPALSRLLFVS
jgi:hypothetical protein